jgi:DNA-binding CsgD family transcriptional regulator
MQLTPQEQACLFALIECYSIEDHVSIDHITPLFEGYLKPLFHCQSLIATVGEIELTEIKVGGIVAVNYPDSFLQQLKKTTSVKERALLAHWLENQQPLYVADAENHILSVFEKEEVQQFDLTPLLIHGQRDLSGKISTYFSFRQCQLEAERAKVLIKIFMPYLHLIMVRQFAWHYKAVSHAQLSLTIREWELISYIKQGQSNKQIALLLHKSPSTIKHQMHALFRKLDVSSREEVIFKLQQLTTSFID